MEHDGDNLGMEDGRTGARECCEYLATCPFFSRNNESVDAKMYFWIRTYCMEKGKSLDCNRRKYREATGKPAPMEMQPSEDLYTDQGSIPR